MTGELEIATWVLAAFTGVLAVATLLYAYLTYKTGHQVSDIIKSLEKVAKIFRETSDNLDDVARHLRDGTDKIENVARHLSDVTDKMDDIGSKIEDVADNIDWARIDRLTK